LALQDELTNTKGELQKTTLEKEELEAKMAKIRKRVDEYNNKIQSLKETNQNLSGNIENLNNTKLTVTDNVVISNEMKEKMAKTLALMPAEELAGAKNLKDSINLVLSYNLKKKIQNSDLNGDDDVKVGVDKTVVMISVADNLLFRSGSYRVNPKAKPLLQKLADVINSEPSMDVMIEGHTDNKGIHTEELKDNWDLSVKRATSIVRILQNKYNVDPSRLIAAGRGEYVPLVDNDTRENRARNRRTNIIILPNLNKFFSLLQAEEHILD
jgi:chemotaxis protein MotB